VVTIKLDAWMWSGATDDARARVYQKDAAGNYIGDVVNTGFTQINDPVFQCAIGRNIRCTNGVCWRSNASQEIKKAVKENAR